MDEVLTIAQIEAQFQSEWVLIEEPNTNEALEVQSGKPGCGFSGDSTCLEVSSSLRVVFSER